MTGFDIGVLVLVGLGATTGFMRGFVQEVLSLGAWAASLLAIHFGHGMTERLVQSYVGDKFGAAAVLAFVLLLILPYLIVKAIAGRIGQASRSSFLGPVDRVIGFGFGAVKGVLFAVIGFSLLVLGYDTAWGVNGRPDWITQSRTYPFINASSDALVKAIGERRRAAADAEATRLKNEDAAPRHRRKHHRDEG